MRCWLEWAGISVYEAIEPLARGLVSLSAARQIPRGGTPTAAAGFEGPLPEDVP